MIIETKTFYFEGTSEVMCCYFAQRDGRVVGDTGTGTAVIHKHTQGSPALLPLAALEGNWPTTTDLSLHTYTSSLSGLKGIRRDFIPVLPAALLRSRLMWHINVLFGKRAKHDGVEEARWRRRRPWQRRQYQRQGKTSHNEQRAGAFPFETSPSEQVSPVVVRRWNSQAICV